MIGHRPWAWLIIGLAALLSPWGFAWAEESADGAGGLQAEFRAAVEAMDAAKQAGPMDVPLLDQAVLKLPAGFIFVPKVAAEPFMRALGNQVGESFMGLILPTDEKANWMVAASYEKSGYIPDGDARDWNVDELLDNLKKSTVEINQARAGRGLSELEVVGWAEPPAYDDASHRLVWSLAVRNQGAPVGEPQSVNYNTYALGREGYISLNLVTALDEIESRKAVAQTLLASLDFNEGKRYQDFNAETDHTAEYGLAALVGGIAAKKLGLFAMLAVFAAKFGKIIAVSALTLFGLFGNRLAGRKKPGTDSMEA